MTKNQFCYTVSVGVTLTKDDVECLIAHSKRHYDGTIKAASVVGGKFYGWKNRLIGYDEVPVTLSFRDLDLMQKTLELAYAPSNTRSRLWSMIIACMQDISRETDRLNKKA